MNHVQALIGGKFSDAEKVVLKGLGPHRPLIHIEQVFKCTKRIQRRLFDGDKWYKKIPWMCGCAVKQAVFCYVCLLFENDDCVRQKGSVWANTGVRDLKHLAEKCITHENSSNHIHNATTYALLGKNALSKTDTIDLSSVNVHNAKVDQNRNILSKVVECIKLCGQVDLKQTGNALDSGLLVGLVNLIADLDCSMKSHFLEGSVSKRLLQSSVQNQLLECILLVCRCEILHEIRAAEFLSIQVCEVTDSSKRPHLLMILRYEISGNLEERFWGIFNPLATTVDSFSKVILEQLNKILPTSSDKLISQSYDGASLLQGPEESIPTMIKKQYQSAHLVHSYAHQLNMIAQQATYSIPALRIFFTSLSSFNAFFADTPKRVAVLNATLTQQHQTPPPFGWDFDSRANSTVFLYAEELRFALRRIQMASNFDGETTREATMLLDLLEKHSFRYWLDQFNTISLQLDVLSGLLQSRETNAKQIRAEVLCLVKALAVKQKITNEDKTEDVMEDEVEDGAEIKVEDEAEDGDGCDGFLHEPPAPKVRRILCSKVPRFVSAKRARDIISSQVKERFSFNVHLAAARLLFIDQFSEYSSKFPRDILDCVCTSYPCLNNYKMRYQLSILYDRPEFRVATNMIELLRFFVSNNLDETYSEVVKLLRIIVTTPMVTYETDRCFTTIQRVKAVLRQTKWNQQLNAFAMLTVEKKFIHDLSSFNTKVIDQFAKIDAHREDFMHS